MDGPHLETLTTRLLPLPALLANLVISALLLVYRDWTTRGFLLTASTNKRATVSFVVQAISTLFGTGNGYVLHSIWNFSARMKLTRSWMDVRRLALWNSLSSGIPDLGLPWGYSLLTVLAYVLSMAFAALWAGAVTPAPTVQQCTLNATIARFSQASREYWDVEFEFEWSLVWNDLWGCRTKWNDNGLFTTCPVPILNGFLLSAATQSSVPLTRKAKFDKSGYTSLNRTYGAGSGVGTSPGLRAEQMDSLGVRSYSFVETGYETSVHCIKNATSAIYFQDTSGIDADDYTPYIFSLYGYLPNSFNHSGHEVYPIATWQPRTYTNMSAWAALHNPIDGTNFLGIAAGPGRYEAFNHTQCEIEFKPSHFQVDVNVTSHTYNITPLTTTSSPARDIDLEPTGNLTAAVVRSMNLLSRMTSNLYVSEVGEALRSSLEGRLAAFGSAEDDDDMVLASVETFLTSLADDILAAYSNGQVYIAGDTSTLKISEARCLAIRRGSHQYIFAVFVLNVVLSLFWLFETLRQKIWKGLPSWDFRNIQDVVAGCVAGSDIVGTATDGDVQWIKLSDSQVAVLVEEDHQAETHLRAKWKVHVK